MNGNCLDGQTASSFAYFQCLDWDVLHKPVQTVHVDVKLSNAD